MSDPVLNLETTCKNESDTHDENDLFEIIKPHLIDERFIAGLYLLYSKLTRLKYSENIFYITSGNALGYFKYGCHLPWDDDLDLGFKSDSSFDNYLNFFETCLRENFIVNVYLKSEKPDTGKWYEDKHLYHLVLDNPLSNKQNANPNSISVNELRSIVKTDPSRFFFGNVTFKLETWQNILKEIDELNLPNINQKPLDYYWAGKYQITPWIDFLLFFENRESGSLVSHFHPYPKQQPSLSNQLTCHRLYSTENELKQYSSLIKVKIPQNLFHETVKFYFGCYDFNTFFNQETIYCHILPHQTKSTFVKLNPEKYHLLKTFIYSYNQRVGSILHSLKSFD